MKFLQKGHRITIIKKQSHKLSNLEESENRNDLYMYIYILYIHI